MIHDNDSLTSYNIINKFLVGHSYSKRIKPFHYGLCFKGSNNFQPWFSVFFTMLPQEHD